jgi:hypothetical protein
MPKQTVPNRITLKQTKACIAKLSCEICTLLDYYAAKSGNSLQTLQDNLSAPSSHVKKFKRENIAQLKLSDNLFFFFLYII